MWDNEVTFGCNYLQVTPEQGVVPGSSSETMKFRVGVRQGIVCLMGRGDSSALVRNPPSDGFTK